MGVGIGVNCSKTQQSLLVACTMQKTMDDQSIIITFVGWLSWIFQWEHLQSLPSLLRDQHEISIVHIGSSIGGILALHATFRLNV